MVAEDAQRDAVGGGGGRPSTIALDAPLGAAPVERRTVGGSGQLLLLRGSAAAGSPSPTSCEITSRPA